MTAVVVWVGESPARTMAAVWLFGVACVALGVWAVRRCTDYEPRHAPRPAASPRAAVDGDEGHPGTPALIRASATPGAPPRSRARSAQGDTAAPCGPGTTYVPGGASLAPACEPPCGCHGHVPMPPHSPNWTSHGLPLAIAALTGGPAEWEHDTAWFGAIEDDADTAMAGTP